MKRFMYLLISARLLHFWNANIEVQRYQKFVLKKSWSNHSSIRLLSNERSEAKVSFNSSACCFRSSPKEETSSFFPSLRSLACALLTNLLLKSKGSSLTEMFESS